VRHCNRHSNLPSDAISRERGPARNGIGGCFPLRNPGPWAAACGCSRVRADHNHRRRQRAIRPHIRPCVVDRLRKAQASAYQLQRRTP
jgi:hypothetical protein